MTNKEFLNESVPEVSQGIKDAVMAARGVDPAAVYNGSKEIELAEADLYMRMTILSSFSEGSLSIKYSESSLKIAANRIYDKYGDPKQSRLEPLIRGIKL